MGLPLIGCESMRDLQSTARAPPHRAAAGLRRAAAAAAPLALPLGAGTDAQDAAARLHGWSEARAAVLARRCAAGEGVVG